MEEIKIYRSMWKNVLVLIACVVFVVLSCVFFEENPTIMILSMLLFGAGGILFLYTVIKDSITDKPYLLITDRKVTMYNSFKEFDIFFADVDTFSATEIEGGSYIVIKYKRSVAMAKFKDSNLILKIFRLLHIAFSGAQESIPASGLEIGSEELCALLNERLEAYNKSNALQ